MSERERISSVPVSSCASVAPKRAPVEADRDALWPRSTQSSAPAPARASPTRSGTLRWGDFARALAEGPPSASPVRGGTLKWGDFAAARAEGLGGARKSPVRGGTLRWPDFAAQLPPVLAVRPREALPTTPTEAPIKRDHLGNSSMDDALAPLLSAGLVRRSGRNVARRRGFDNRRDPTDRPPSGEFAAVQPRDLASAIQDALEDDDVD